MRNPVNTCVFKSTITQIWKVKHGFEVRDLDQNLFTLHFFQRKDHDLVLKKSHRNFDRNLIVLDYVKSYYLIMFYIIFPNWLL